MTAFKLILAEIRFRLLSFLLSLLAVVVAAMLFVVGPTLISGYASATRVELEKLDGEATRLQTETESMQAETAKVLAQMDDQTRRIMRDLGVNLRIVHRDTKMDELYTNFVAVDFPEDYVDRLSQAKHIETMVHLVATLQHKLQWKNRTILLVGTLPVMTQAQKAEQKPHMVKRVAPGTVLVGHELGVGLQEGDTLEIEGQPLKIAKIMPEFGGLEDIQLVVDLHDAQKIVNKAGRINQILALSCKCKGDRLSVVQKELETILPDTKVTEQTTQATAREQQRDLVAATRKQELAQVQANLARITANRDRQLASRAQQQRTLTRLVSLTTPLAVLASALFVGLMTWLNVRERRPEIGVLRALGKRAGYVAALFLGKAILLGLLGGVLGCASGYFLAPRLGASMLELTTTFFRTDPRILAATIVGAPLVTAMASYLPTLSAVSQDPAIVLMDN
ncbi:MAG: FtsX-like permease family protein [Planctomycetota bacterium]|nr:FtsX-like permease family protein [Planctomycetota bacterium]